MILEKFQIPNYAMKTMLIRECFLDGIPEDWSLYCDKDFNIIMELQVQNPNEVNEKTYEIRRTK